MYRYIGNKTKLLPVILGKIGSLVPQGSTVCDLMAGTGSVSYALRAKGYRVVASDVMTYSKCHLTKGLLFDKEPDFSGLGLKGYQGVLGYLNSLPPKCGYFYNEFAPDGKPANGLPPRKYFTSSNAAKIDAIREQINQWEAEGSISQNECLVLKHTLILAANSVANISGTYGYFLSSFKDSSKKEVSLEPEPFYPGRVDNVVLQGFAEDLSSAIVADLCYIDPPYMKRQYAANYHILETLARGDYPEAIGKSGLRNWWDQHSKFCTKTRIFDAFRKIFEGMRCPLFVISYSEDGLIEIGKLCSFFKEFGRVSLEEINYQRFRSNDSKLGKELKEYLITVDRR